MTVAGGLTITHTSTVTPDQIDHLGHMNVRYYAVNARAGTRSFVGDGAIVEMYTRHHREQLVDANLEVRSGILGVDGHARSGTIRVYHELANSETGDIAATFVHRIRTDTPPDHLDTIDIPDHGRPRSIDIHASMASPSLEDVRRFDLAMRQPREVDADDTLGGDTAATSMMPFLFWGGTPVDGPEQELVHKGPDGQDVGWATMETRVVINRLPALGTRIQSFSATTSVADKTTQASMWVYDLDSRELLASFEVVSVLFDIDARRAMSIPDDIRREHLEKYHPEFGSRPADEPDAEEEGRSTSS